jgi:hypothetical protein
VIIMLFLAWASLGIALDMESMIVTSFCLTSVATLERNVIKIESDRPVQPVEP